VSVIWVTNRSWPCSAIRGYVATSLAKRWGGVATVLEAVWPFFSFVFSCLAPYRQLLRTIGVAIPKMGEQSCVTQIEQTRTLRSSRAQIAARSGCRRPRSFCSLRRCVDRRDATGEFAASRCRRDTCHLSSGLCLKSRLSGNFTESPFIKRDPEGPSQSTNSN
jgi:hypothetical protein